MFEPDSFLRKLPVALDLETRLRFEAIVFAMDVLEYAHAQMRSVAMDIASSGIGNIEPKRRVALFEHAWSMVDQTHTLRLLLRQLPLSPGGVVQTFVDDHEPATLARNYMDHIPQMIRNVAGRKRAEPPVFGSVTFSAFDERHFGPPDPKGQPVAIGCRLITLMSGSMTHPQHVLPVARGFGAEIIDVPVGRFELAVSEHVVQLSRAFHDARAVAERLEATVPENVKRAVHSQAPDAGLDPEKVLAEHSGALDIEAEIGFE